MKTLPFSRRSTSRPGLRLSLNKAAVFGLLTALVVLPVYADDLADVTKAVRAGQYADALSRADTFLVKHPHDAQMRFLKGVILTEQNKSAEAIVVFTKLTEDFPELPEPYNNLAVLFAASGQYDKARLALDAAIRTNPAYATAYENLGDVHAKLASQAYDKALQLDSGNAAAKSKLTLLRTLTGSSAINSKAPAATTPAVAPVVTPVAALASKPVVVAPAKPPVMVAAAAPSTPMVKPPKPEVKPEAKPEPKPVPKPTAEDEDSGEILAAVHSWAKAWSEQDVKAYLNFYGNDFETPNGETRKAWAEERHQRIEGKGRIDVKIESPQVNVNGNTATVKFRQIYVSDRLKADSHKVLILTKQGGKWQIKQERAGS
jgi:tetratricopeptide (TPR) repeat protein